MGRFFGLVGMFMMVCIVFFIGVIFQILGFVVFYWVFDGIYDVGLWWVVCCKSGYYFDCYREDYVEYFILGQ